VGLLSFVDFVG